MAIFAVGLLAYPLYTNFYQDRLQSKLAIEFKQDATKQAFVAGEIADRRPDHEDLHSGCRPEADGRRRGHRRQRTSGRGGPLPQHSPPR